MTQELVLSLTRKVLAMCGAILVNRGFMNQNDMTELVAGIAAVLVSVGWTWWQDRRNARTLSVAISVPAGTSLAAVKTLAASDAVIPPARKTRRKRSGLPQVGVLLVAALLLSPACAAKSAPVLVAQASLGIAQTIGSLQTAAITLHKAGLVDARAALRVQERLLRVNGQVAEIVPYLKAVDRVQVSGVRPTRADVDALIGQVLSAMQELALVGVDVPGGEETRAFLELVRAAQGVLTTTLIELARIRTTIGG